MLEGDTFAGSVLKGVAQSAFAQPEELISDKLEQTLMCSGLSLANDSFAGIVSGSLILDLAAL